MRFLHTADFHLGKMFYEKSLLEDQDFMLRALRAELEGARKDGEPYSALVIAGDVYDRSVPPADAVELLGNFLTDIHQDFPDIHILLLAGNHDSAERLSFLKGPLSKQNIHICTDCASITEPVIVDGAAFYQLPYLTPGCIKRRAEGDGIQPPLFGPETRLRGQQELLDEAVRQITEAHRASYGELPCILCAHLFAAGSGTGGQETGTAGGTDQIDAGVLEPFTYVALGHIHSAQKAAHNAWYSGSPLAYSFDERDSEKYFLSVTVSSCSAKDTAVKKIPVVPLHAVKSITCSFDDAMHNPGYGGLRDCYIQVNCTDKNMIENPMPLLRTRFPNVLSFCYTKSRTDTGSASLSERRRLLSRKEKSFAERIFTAFLCDLYGEDALSKDALVKEETEIFLRIAGSLEEQS